MSAEGLAPEPIMAQRGPPANGPHDFHRPVACAVQDDEDEEHEHDT